jgi:outer membrane protein, multidrug efflux system
MLPSEILIPMALLTRIRSVGVPPGVPATQTQTISTQLEGITFHVLLFTSLVLLLAGCAVGPDYHAPKTEVSAAFANGAQTNLASGQIAIAWWRGFDDEKLNLLVNQALATNQDLRIATARVLEARALRNSSVADLFPEVNTSASYSKSVSSKDSIPFPLSREQRQLELYNAGFDATWEIDLFGHVRRSIEANNANLASMIAERQDVLISLVSEIARNYFELRGGQHTLAVALKNAENQRETLDISVARFKAGRATELDTSQAKAQLDRTLAAIPPLEAAIKHSIYRLSVLTGQQPAALESELIQPAPMPALPALVNIGDPAELMRRRPDIRAAERALAAATARIGVETSALFPKVTFNGNLGFSAKNLSGLGNAGTDTYAFGPQITWAILDYAHIRARMQAAHANADIQLAAYEKTVLTALEETENALVDFDREQARRNYLQESARAAEQASTLARQRYEGGIADFLPVLDAERTQLEVEALLASSQTRTATYLVAVYKALGGGWEIENAPEPSADTPRLAEAK